MVAALAPSLQRGRSEAFSTSYPRLDAALGVGRVHRASLTARFEAEASARIQPAEHHALLPECRYQFAPVRS
jgi:hypothetical protein